MDGHFPGTSLVTSGAPAGSVPTAIGIKPRTFQLDFQGSLQSDADVPLHLLRPLSGSKSQVCQKSFVPNTGLSAFISVHSLLPSVMLLQPGKAFLLFLTLAKHCCLRTSAPVVPSA